MKAWHYLDEYYLCKLKAAMCLLRYRAGDGQEYQTKAVSLLEQALGHWRNLSEIGSRHFIPYYMGRVNHYFGWCLYLDEVERDILLAKQLTK